MKTNHFFILKKEKNNSNHKAENNSKIISLRSSSKKKKTITRFYSNSQAKLESKNNKPPNGSNAKFQKESILKKESSSNQLIAQRTGRWEKEEHVKFLKGLITYGNDWKMVQKIIKTRSSSQSRSHAQKFFLKLKNSIKSAKISNNQKDLYEYIFQKNKCMLDFEEIKLFNEDEKKQLLNVILSSINLFEKNRKNSTNKKSSYEYCNKYNIYSQSDNHSFHSDEDDDSSENENDNNLLMINKKRKRSNELINKNISSDEVKMSNKPKIFNIIKVTKYKNSTDFSINKNKNEKNKYLNSNNFNNSSNDKKIKQKFTIYTNDNELNNAYNNIKNNINHNNINYQNKNMNVVINNNIININNNYSNVNNTNIFDQSTFNIINNNKNTININNIHYFSNESNKGIQYIENWGPIFMEHNNLYSSQKKIKYDYNIFNGQNDKENNFDLKENDNNEELSSLGNKNNMSFVCPI